MSKKDQSERPSLTPDWVLGSSQHMREGQRRGDLLKGFYLWGCLAAGTTRESFWRQSSNSNCLFQQQIFEEISAQWNSAITDDWLLAIAGFLWSTLWEINFTAQAGLCFEAFSGEADGICDAWVPGFDVTASLMRDWCFLTVQVPRSDAILWKAH